MDTSDSTTDQTIAFKKSRQDDCECFKCASLTEILLEMKSQLGKLDKLDEIRNSVNDLKDELGKATQNVNVLQHNVQVINEGLEQINYQIEGLKSDRKQIETELRKINLIISGIGDDENETETVYNQRCRIFSIPSSLPKTLGLTLYQGLENTNQINPG